MRDWAEPVIERMARFRPDGSKWLLAVLAVLGAALVLAREVTYGPGLHWDSINYIGVARNLLAGDGFVEISGSLYASWPPLYPLLLAAASLGVFDPHAVAGPLNAAIFGLTVLAAGHYLRQRLESGFLALWGSLAVMLSLPLAETASWVLSEPAFILFTLLALIQTDTFLSEGKRSALLWAAALTALACLTRFMGVAVLAAVVPLLVLQHGVTWLERLKRITAYVLIAAAPVCLWMLRTSLFTGQPAGHRGFSGQSLPEVMGQIAKVFAQWVFHDLLPHNLLSIAAKPAAGSALLALTIVVGYGFVHWHRKREAWTGGLLLPTFGGFALAYMAALVAAAMLGTFEHGIQSRYVTPLYIPLLFLMLWLTDRSLYHAREQEVVQTTSRLPTIDTSAWAKYKVGWPVLLMTTLSLWLAWQMVLNARAIERANNGIGLGYANARFADSEVLQYIRGNPINGFVFSNDVYPIYIHTDETAIFSDLPHHRKLSDDVVWMGEFLTTRNEETFRDQSTYETVVSGDPVLRSRFDVYLGKSTLTYVKAPCSRTDTKAPFLLHIVPADTNDLPDHRRRYGFDNYDFYFDRNGAHFDGKCMVTVKLPTYPVARIRTGQFIRTVDKAIGKPANEQHWIRRWSESVADGSHIVWFHDFYANIRLDYRAADLRALPKLKTVAEFSDGVIFQVDQSAGDDDNPYRSMYEAAVAAEPISRSHFSVYVDEHALTYIREPCSLADMKPKFFLHIIPADARDLSDHRKRYGFDNYDFDFKQRGVRFDGKCMATVNLPDYDIVRIRTGQFVSGEGQLWKGEFLPYREEG